MLIIHTILITVLGFLLGFYLGPLGCALALFLGYGTTLLLLNIKDRKRKNQND